MKARRFTIADDDADALFLLHRMIEQLYPHSSISTFSNAEDALAHIRDTEPTCSSQTTVWER